MLFTSNPCLLSTPIGFTHFSTKSSHLVSGLPSGVFRTRTNRFDLRFCRFVLAPPAVPRSPKSSLLGPRRCARLRRRDFPFGTARFRRRITSKTTAFAYISRTFFSRIVRERRTRTRAYNRVVRPTIYRPPFLRSHSATSKSEYKTPSVRYYYDAYTGASGSCLTCGTPRTKSETHLLLILFIIINFFQTHAPSKPYATCYARKCRAQVKRRLNADGVYELCGVDELKSACSICTCLYIDVSRRDFR